MVFNTWNKRSISITQTRDEEGNKDRMKKMTCIYKGDKQGQGKGRGNE